MSTISKFITRRFMSLLPNESSSAELWQLFSPVKHSALLKQRRAVMIVNRVRFFALLFAVLTPLWGIVDFMAFDTKLFLQLAALRITTSLALTALLVFYRPTGGLVNAYSAIAILFTLPTLFYIASYSLLNSYQMDTLPTAIVSGYSFLPFLLMAGLAIFPLSVTENLLLAAILVCAQAVTGYLNWSTFNYPTFAGSLWLLTLIAGATTLAGISQLAFMITLVHQMIHDPLTDAFSRGSGQEVLTLQWANAQRHKQPLTLAFIDIDYFKRVNDEFGHDAGDTVLRDFTAAFSKNLRDSDCLIRWGGEEFLMVMPNTNLEQGQIAMERIQAAGLGNRPEGTPLTVSIGLAERITDKVETADQLLSLADHRMYLAKNNGRNQICFNS